jgi:hypothetical protein
MHDHFFAHSTGNILILLEMHSFLRATLCKLSYKSYASLQNKRQTAIFSELLIVPPFVLQIHLHLKLYKNMYVILNEPPFGKLPSVLPSVLQLQLAALAVV